MSITAVDLVNNAEGNLIVFGRNLMFEVSKSNRKRPGFCKMGIADEQAEGLLDGSLIPLLFTIRASEVKRLFDADKSPVEVDLK